MISKLLSRSTALCRTTVRTFSTSPSMLDASAKLNKPARFSQPISASDIPKGYVVSSTYAGIKAAISPKPDGNVALKPSNPNPKPDLALIVSTVPAAAAGTFTRNVFKAAPVVISNQVLLDAANKEGGARVQSVLVNSGCANAVTGHQGMADAKQCVELVKKNLAPHPGLAQSGEGRETLLLSTGVIGVPLPMPTIKRCIPHLSNGMILNSSPDSWRETARAFMTTDTFPKLRAKTFELGGKQVRMIGIDKGAGMIHPAMTGPQVPTDFGVGSGQLHATMLGLIATDAAVKPAALQTALNRAVARSFNCISVDGDMSTNDTIILLANGQSDPTKAREVEMDESSHDFEPFVQQLTSFCQDLSKLIVRDGEGAEKFVEITCTNAPNFTVAHGLLSRLVTSMLFKCAIHGEDANWGRILASVGGAEPGLTENVDPSKVSVAFVDPIGELEPITVLSDGNPVKVDEDQMAKLLTKEDIKIMIDLKNGKDDCTYWTCDLSREYIDINADYRS
ncbi:probable Arginine biosynthesis bifunctional protein ArgJ, mitochondrial [Melanopsichium pennsylvanicum]|uniref:Arginine biosynthesis bifunctional protein ArgJ, mitochondrial n=2 Tax=Melanopsichium pennsylvanicum TaxID=63383 RepID=A0AAJ5C5B1_9BASI|nr:related to ECM40-acetylornithine acetyltransferase [Melanopsichium pennsylvanicum 4]SNX84388.1 probable Arginine biosynthesis bifunctional protein ArgJ, mitochondrial [Melanopsichium pennsylvanicum]